MSVTAAAIRDAIVEMLEARGVDKTCCPSDIAGALGADQTWRELMPRVWQVAAVLAGEGRIRITQSGETIDSSDEITGPIRLGLSKR